MKPTDLQPVSSKRLTHLERRATRIILPNRLREQRERSRLTQDELAAFLGVTKSIVSRYESSERAISPDMLKRLARLFKIETHELFFTDEQLGYVEGELDEDEANPTSRAAAIRDAPVPPSSSGSE